MHGDEIAPLMARLPGWALAEGGRLERSFRFPDFVTAVAFVNRITTVAEALGIIQTFWSGGARCK